MAEDLRGLWAGGYDVWPRLPDGDCVYTRPATQSDATCQWPPILEKSVLFSFGAYNPLGEVREEAVNKAQHEKLGVELDIALQELGHGVRWASCGRFEDGSEEFGYTVAFDEGSSRSDEGRNLVRYLAERYEQGAVYEYKLREGRLIRSTVPVLLLDTEADVEVTRINEDGSPFSDVE
eukprot:TRINITY_DN81699_c0_g1_i1.p1 TRINITY_DN81699_c0_g1~~TRINITY_DN81699_c0_g1_i1.p1  ORF type:complete len:197 (+),score=33.60 TRINITY_DN81699_c0_g1_i1:59-592(+)